MSRNEQRISWKRYPELQDYIINNNHLSKEKLFN